eukprot:CAMPEP_0177735388 /NCGR_PEP_ID=MMETSP0484_2-20121128/24746_1 /TAXON_ID=354590 /ORGANISM="Rhodomonas lens, Strain RHODO" /LENGTH=256 /DNA_ID=CAMNT_0019248941 /DNA_START=136 /DNA_END=904 /DNA_ORIENTATION=-
MSSNGFSDPCAKKECKQLAAQTVEVEEQNQALREENALAFTKIYKKLESASTSEGLQKEMLSLKEGTDNRMLVLENLMRDIGGDKMKGLIQDVNSLQHDTVALWKENARMILEIEQRVHQDQLQAAKDALSGLHSELKHVQAFTSDAAQSAREEEVSEMKEAIGKVLAETELSSRLVRSCVERTDQTVLAKTDTDRWLEELRSEVAGQGKALSEAQSLVRALLGAQKRFAVELDDLGSNVRSRAASALSKGPRDSQ